MAHRERILDTQAGTVHMAAEGSGSHNSGTHNCGNSAVAQYPAYESYLGLSGDPYWVDDGPGRRGANAKKAYKQGGGTQLCPHLLVLLNLQRST